MLGPSVSSPEVRETPEAPTQPFWRRALPFVLAGVLIAIVLSRVELDAFFEALRGVSYVAFFMLTFGFTLAILAADSFASVVLYRWTVAPIRYRDFLLLRGASYLPALLNHHVGQAFLTYTLSRAYSVKLARVAGTTLIVYASWAGCILTFGTGALAIQGDPKWLVFLIVAGVAYLALIGLKPKWLVDRTLLAPLFETGVVGHLVAVAARIPHFCVIFGSTWAIFEIFGIHIPWQAACLHVPVLMVISTLPVTPLGFGTRDAFASLVFTQYATGTEAEQLSQIGAATLSWGIGLMLASAVVGFVLMRFALRRFASEVPTPPAGGPSEASA